MAGDPSSEERLDWRVAAAVTVLGVGAIVVGLYLADFDRGAWSGLSIEVGAAIALVAILFVLERRLIARTRTTAETAARTAAREVTHAIEERLVRLEELDDAQLQRREERRRQAKSRSEAVRTEGLDATKVGELLKGAADSSLFDHQNGFRVRTSEAPDCPVLYLLALVFADGAWLFLDFEPIRISGRMNDGIPVPDSSDTLELWSNQSAGEIAGALEASLERLNIAPDKFRFRYALDRLVRSEEVMRAARSADSGSSVRLEGRLRILIHDDWAWTDWGLESVTTGERYKAEHGVAHHGDGSGSFPIVLAVDVPPEVRENATGSLREALTWLTDRERISLDVKPHRIARSAQDIRGLRR